MNKQTNATIACDYAHFSWHFFCARLTNWQKNIAAERGRDTLSAKVCKIIGISRFFPDNSCGGTLPAQKNKKRKTYQTGAHVHTSSHGNNDVSHFQTGNIFSNLFESYAIYSNLRFCKFIEFVALRLCWEPQKPFNFKEQLFIRVNNFRVLFFSFMFW